MRLRTIIDRTGRTRLIQGLLAACIAVTVANAAAAGADAEPSDLTYSGTAKSLQGAHFLYGERHFIEYRGGKIAGRVVLYTCRDGTAFARKTVTYDGTAAGSLAPNFSLEDDSNGLREGVRGEGDARSVFFRANAGSAEKTSPLPMVPGLVVDAGFDEFIRTHWQRLNGGESLAIHFLIPSRLNEMVFQVQHLRADRVGGIPVEVFRLQLSGFFGWFLPGIDVYYSVNDHVLMRYVGLSDLRDGSGDNMKVDILFNPTDRHPSAPTDIAAARHAPLARCH